MDDPFIKWVDIEIPYTLANQIPDLIELINSDSLKKTFLYGDCDGYNQLTLYFFHKDSDTDKQFTGRTINLQNPILNVSIRGRAYFVDSGGGLTFVAKKRC